MIFKFQWERVHYHVGLQRIITMQHIEFIYFFQKFCTPKAPSIQIWLWSLMQMALWVSMSKIYFMWYFWAKLYSSMVRGKAWVFPCAQAIHLEHQMRGYKGKLTQKKKRKKRKKERKKEKKRKGKEKTGKWGKTEEIISPWPLKNHSLALQGLIQT